MYIHRPYRRELGAQEDIFGERGGHFLEVVIFRSVRNEGNILGGGTQARCATSWLRYRSSPSLYKGKFSIQLKYTPTRFGVFQHNHIW